jgi:hypothetical protein
MRCHARIAIRYDSIAGEYHPKNNRIPLFVRNRILEAGLPYGIEKVLSRRTVLCTSTALRLSIPLLL